MITLVIIGVIAAMTVPTLIHKHRAEEFESRFKKAVTVLNSAVNYMRFETNQELTVENFSPKTFKNVFNKYFHVIEDCGARDCFDNAKPTYRNYTNNANAQYSILDDGNFVLNDGMTIFLDNDTTDLQVSIDINGYKKKPNRWGYDLFTFTLATKNSNYSIDDIAGKGRFYPAGHPYTRWRSISYCSKDGESVYNGIGCTYNASKNPNYFKDLSNW